MRVGEGVWRGGGEDTEPLPFHFLHFTGIT